MSGLLFSLRQMTVLSWRHALVFGRRLPLFVCLYILGPVILMYGLSVAFGLESKLVFIVPGMMINTVAIAAYIGCSYGAMERFYGQRYESWLGATLKPWQLVGAEALFQAGKGLLSGTGIWVAGLLLGLPWNLAAFLAALPVLVVVGAVAGMLGYCVVAVAKSYDDIALTEPLMTAVFMFSGVFVAIGLFPTPIQLFAQVLPIYHGIELIRPAFIQTPLEPDAIIRHSLILIGMLAAAFGLATHLFRQRLLAS